MASLAALANAGGSRSGGGDGPAAKRLKTEATQNVGTPYYSTLFTIFSQMREEALKRSSAGQAASGLEIEIRIGMIVQNERRLQAQVTAQEPMVLVYESVPGSSMRFVAGVDEPFLEDIKKALAEKNFIAVPQAPQRLVLDNQGRRLEVDTIAGSGETKFRAKGNVAAERKDRIYRKDLALLSHGYDIRMDAAYEIPIVADDRTPPSASDSTQEVVLDGKPWYQMRLKKRMRYKQQHPPSNGSSSSSSASQAASSWKVDITEVNVTQLSHGGSGREEIRTRELEVEIELEGAAGKEWLEKPAGEAQMVTNRLLNELMSILNICVPCDTMAFASAADAASASLGEPCGPAYEKAASSLTSMIKRSLDASHTLTSFVGTMPVSLSRRSLLPLQRSAYFIAEKTDGVRYLLYVIEDPGHANTGGGNNNEPLAVLIDRKGAVFNIKGGRTIGAALGKHSVVDGELVYNRSTRSMVFLLFDVLAVHGVSKAALPFSERYKCLEMELVARYKRYMEDTTKVPPRGEDKKHATPLVRKVFYKKEQLPLLVGKLRTEEGERVFFDNTRRHWKSDGIVFQPDSPYVIAADHSLLKWKWPELRSVDLQARVSSYTGTNGGIAGIAGTETKFKVGLFAMGPDGVYIDCTASGTSLPQFDQYRLLADISDLATSASSGAPGKPPVIEVVYDTNYGLWRYKTIRTDKKEPNAISTVMGVLMELAESIPIEELEYCFGSAEALTDFTRQVSKMKRQLLDWQRKQQQGPGQKR